MRSLGVILVVVSVHRGESGGRRSRVAKLTAVLGRRIPWCLSGVLSISVWFLFVYFNCWLRRGWFGEAVASEAAARGRLNQEPVTPDEPHGCLLRILSSSCELAEPPRRALGMPWPSTPCIM